jgi:hypothetical protein
MSRIDECLKCGQPFYVNEIGGQMPGGRESEDISCPHCRHTFTERSSGTFRTSTLSAEAELQWKKDKLSSKK